METRLERQTRCLITAAARSAAADSPLMRHFWNTSVSYWRNQITGIEDSRAIDRAADVADHYVDTVEFVK